MCDACDYDQIWQKKISESKMLLHCFNVNLPNFRIFSYRWSGSLRFWNAHTNRIFQTSHGLAFSKKFNLEATFWLVLHAEKGTWGDSETSWWAIQLQGGLCYWTFQFHWYSDSHITLCFTLSWSFVNNHFICCRKVSFIQCLRFFWETGMRKDRVLKS